MFANLIVGVDGRPGGADAVALAKRLVSADGRLTLVNVHGGITQAALTAVPNRPDPDQQSLAVLREAQQQADVDAELLSITAASPGRALHVLAEERSADLIVVGSCRRGTLGRVMLGDDTKAALNGAPCGVAVAAKGYADTQAPLAKIGVGYDASPESEQALRLAREIATEHHCLIEVVEVVSIPAYAFAGVTPPALGESIEEMIQAAEAELATLPDVDHKAVYGLPGEELARFGDEVDLLLVGSRGYGPMRRLVLGSTANYLQRHARCALLVLPRLSGAKPTATGRQLGAEQDGQLSVAQDAATAAQSDAAERRHDREER